MRTEDQGRLNLDACLALFDGMVEAGLDTVVISPGSRSTPLVLAADLHPQLHTQVILDERSAAFFALGMARVSARPVALVCTSGSAPAHWFPAVIEADASGVPLILLSADRPAELHNCGANQTTDQNHLYGAHVRAFHAWQSPQQEMLPRNRALGRQLVQQTLGLDPGPVHVNLPFREPLLPDHWPLPVSKVRLRPAARPRLDVSPQSLEALLAVLRMQRGVIIAGPGTDSAQIIELARVLDVPLLADPLSDLRFQAGGTGGNLLSHYDVGLESSDSTEMEADWILRFGAMPVSAHLQRWLGRQRGKKILVDPRGRWPDPLANVDQLLVADAEILCRKLLSELTPRASCAWMAVWRDCESRAGSKSLSPHASLIRRILAAMPDDSILFCANSLSIRLLDAYGGSGEKRVRILGNRGVSGIDGNLSTALGMCSAWKGKGIALAILGDLSFQHDLHALAGMAGVALKVVVFNNGGGGIFRQLPQRHVAGFERYWLTPQQVDFSHIAGLYGVAFQRMEAAENSNPLNAFLGQHRHHLEVLEIIL